MGAKDSKEADNLPATLTGLYPNCRWDPKIIKRFISNKKLAPIYVGKEASEEANDELEECPICFLYYPGGLNRFGCCKKSICTECFLQISTPNSTSGLNCPYCNRTNCFVSFFGPRSAEEKAKEAEEKQKVIELQIKIRNEEKERDKQRQDSFSSSSSLDSSLLQTRSAPSFTSLEYPPPHFPYSSSGSPLQTSLATSFRSTQSGRSSQPTSNAKRRFSSGSSRRRMMPVPSPGRQNVDEQWGDMTPEDIEEMLIKQAIEMSLSEMSVSESEQHSIDQEDQEEAPHNQGQRRRHESTSTISTTKTRSGSSRSSISSDEEPDLDMELALAISLSLQNSART